MPRDEALNDRPVNCPMVPKTWPPIDMAQQDLRLPTIVWHRDIEARGMASGISAASCYLLGFIATKSYYDFEIWFSLPGVTLLYAIISVIGFFVLYATLPETEGRSLEEIEMHFSDNSKKITDRYIKKASKTTESKSPIPTDDTKPQTIQKVQEGCDNIGFVTETIDR